MTKKNSAKDNSNKNASTPRVKIAYVTQAARKPSVEMLLSPDWNGNVEVGNRVFTIASQLNSKGTKLNYQIAACAPLRKCAFGHGTSGDNFSKAIGRKIATGRLASSAFTASVPSAEEGQSKAETITRALYTHIAKNDKLPSSVRRFFERELRSRVLWSSPKDGTLSSREPVIEST